MGGRDQVRSCESLIDPFGGGGWGGLVRDPGAICSAGPVRSGFR